MGIDLHLHTTASDGTYTPEQMVEEAKRLGYTAIAITDHDTVEGIPAALQRGQEVGLEVVPGIELNTDYQKREIHVLGYYLDIENAEFRAILEELQDARMNRVKRIVEKLNDLGYKISYERVKEIAGEGAMGRPHIAQALLEAEYVSDWQDAFENFIGTDCPAYVPRTKLTPYEAVKLILSAGGVPVLAHPGLNNLDEMIPGLIDAGLKGIEVYHFEHTEDEKEYYLEIAEKNGLIVTGGSDCHGPGKKSGIRLGQVKLPYELLENLKRSKRALMEKSYSE